jgi:hypothetical protein
MTLSRTVAGFLAGFAAASAPAQLPIDYRLPPRAEPPLRTELRPGCAGTSTDEIIVCGTREEDERYRVAYEPVPGARRRLIAGEVPRGVGALADDEGRCSPVGPNPQCTRGLDLFGIAFTIVRAIARARANRD